MDSCAHLMAFRKRWSDRWLDLGACLKETGQSQTS